MRAAGSQLIVLASALFLLLNSCAPSRFVKPLAKKQHAASFSLGGPLIRFAGAPIPMPFTTLAYGYGLSNRVTCFGSLHTTSLLFGNLQTDLGATLGIYEKENSFGFSASPTLQMACSMGNAGTFRLWPSLDMNAYFHPGKKRSYIYAGPGAWFELSQKKAHAETVSQHLVPNINAGYVIVKDKWQHQLQLSYLSAGTPNLPGIVDYIGVAGRGSLGFYYALVRKF